MATEMTTVIKKIVPYLQRRGYNLDDNMFFGARAENEQEKAGFVDILIKRSARANTALFLIEAKRDSAKLTAEHRRQALNYGKVIHCPFVVVTNGEEFELYNVGTGKKIKINGSVIGKVPLYERLDHVLAQFKASPTTDNIDLGSDTSLPFRPGLNLPQLHALIRRCHNTIRNVEKDEENVFADVSKLLFLKLLEEKQDRGELDFELPYTYRFHELALRKKTADQVKDASLRMLQQVVDLPSYGDVMTPTLNMANPATYLKVVTELSRTNFTDSELDVRGSAFEYFVQASLKGRKLGQFFTPRPLVRFMLSLIPLEQIIPELLDPNSRPMMVDPSCGSGGFLLAAMNQLLNKVSAETGRSYTKERAEKLRERIKKEVFWGADANRRIASTAKMNMIIAGDGFANIRHGDSLKDDVDFLRVKDRALPLVDYLVTNPPFGMSESGTLSEDDLQQFSIQLTKTQALFLQKMVKITRPTGRICTVIDDGMLNTGAMARIRKYLISECFIDSVVRLPGVTFEPNHINVRSSVLLMTRKPNEDAAQEHPIRMIDLRTLGYNSMGEEDTKTPIEAIIQMIRSRWEDMARITLSLDDTGGTFRSFPLRLSDVLAEEDARLDLKYYDPDTLTLVEQLKSVGAKSIEQLVTEPIRRGKSPIKSEYNADLSSDVIVVKAGNVGPSGIVTRFDLVAENVYDRLEGARLRKYDLLLASTGEGTLGKAAVYDLDKRAIADGHVTILRLKVGIQPEYAAWFLRSRIGQAQITRLFTGSTGQIELPEDEVKRILIFVPDENKQARLVGEWVAEVHSAQKLEDEAVRLRQLGHQRFVDAISATFGTTA
jgi:type I restriction enzyme M protein